jgi:hypothetical protein
MVSADPVVAATASGRFLFWQRDNVASLPMIRNNAASNSQTDMTLARLPLQAPLRLAKLLGSKALFIDNLGNLIVMSTASGMSTFTYRADRAADAVLIDDKNLLIAQPASAGAPFVKVNIETGQTIPLSYPAAAGTSLYRASNGDIYAGITNVSDGQATASLIKLNVNNPASSTVLVQYRDKDNGFHIALNDDYIASTIGHERTTFYSSNKFGSFQRGASIASYLTSGGRYFISLGTDGAISWFEAATGRLAGRLTLYDNEWFLTRSDGNRLLSGPIVK